LFFRSPGYPRENISFDENSSKSVDGSLVRSGGNSVFVYILAADGPEWKERGIKKMSESSGESLFPDPIPIDRYRIRTPVVNN